MQEALQRSTRWWQAREVKRIFPDHQTVVIFNDWRSRFNIGRKRILDTMLAATVTIQGVPKPARGQSPDLVPGTTTECPLNGYAGPQLPNMRPRKPFFSGG